MSVIAKEYRAILDNSHHFTNVWFVNPTNPLLARVRSDEAFLQEILRQRRDADAKNILIFETEFMPADESVLVDGIGRHWVINEKQRRGR